MNNKILSYYTKLLVGVTFLLLIAGGLVTSTKSGLSVPDWPLSYGQWMPPMVGGVRFEHTHRMIASLVGFMTLILALWLGFSERRKWVRWTGIAALGMVVAQGILGGITVLYLLPAPVSILHACLAQTFFSVTIFISYITSKEWSTQLSFSVTPAKAGVQRPTMDSRFRGNDTHLLTRVAITMVMILYIQLILGATLRHTSNQLIAVSHIIWGFVVLFHSAMVMTQTVKFAEGEKKLTRPALFLGLITLLQMGLGMGAFIFMFMLEDQINLSNAKVLFITAHQSLGALILATAVFLALRVWKKNS